MEVVAARLGDDADLAAGAGAVLRGIAAGLHAELLDVLQARLQLERRRDFAVQVAGRRVDDRGALDAVVADDVLLHRAAAEPDVLPRAGAGVLRAGRLKQQLRHLAPVDRQAVDLARADVDADARRAQIEHRRRPRDGDRLLHAGRLELEVERELLADRQRHRRVFDRREAVLVGLDGVGGRLERPDQEEALIVGHAGALLTRALVPGRHLGAGDERAAGVADRAGQPALIGLGVYRYCAHRQRR